ncbi:hypothetical protein TrST_g11442 [Triparma strigata]|uniref:sn-1-specific diacylglycerol lipase n=1 Tax=Triparma strigata TaxID=1606541 RepID=A0A9W7A9S9_9STRA|nr:hypothetical protein TrST_g11442 [Triparma strigata]
MEKVSRYEADDATSWEERKQKASSVISAVRAPMVSALSFSDQCCTLGFSIGLRCIRFGFNVGSLIVQGTTHLTTGMSRANATIRFVAEVVGYAEMITISVVSMNSTLTHVGLQTALHALHLGEHMSVTGILGLLASTGFWGSFSHSTLSALSATKDLFANEISPLATELNITKLGEAVKRAKESEREEDQRRIEERLLSGEGVELSLDMKQQQDITKYIRFALGTYGEKGLKFLGIIPYGSATSNNESFLRLSNIESALDIISTDFEGGLYSPGYVLSVDRDSKSVVLAVRGTIWPHDFLTDLICIDEELPCGGSAHSGMFKSALNLASQIRPLVVNLLSRPKYADFKLTLTGHSLGAGVAALMVYIWTSPEHYPNLAIPTTHLKDLHCYGYGCPAILTEELANKMSQKVTSVVIGEDMVPRFSLRSFRKMRDNVLNELLMSEGGGVEDDYNTSGGMPVLLPAGKIVWIDESTAECDASVRKPRDFNVMHMSSCSFEAHMPQNYFQKMNEKAERGWKIGRLGRRGET